VIVCFLTTKPFRQAARGRENSFKKSLKTEGGAVGFTNLIMKRKKALII